MRWKPALVIVGTFLILLLIIAIGLSRSVSAVLVSHERTALANFFPLVRTLILAQPNDTAQVLAELKRLSGIDAFILGPSGVVEQSSTNAVPVGSTLALAGGKDTIFEAVSIAGEPSFALSSPVTMAGAEKRLAIAEPSELLGSFLDELLTIMVVAGFAAIAFSLFLAFYLTHGEVLAFRKIGEAFQALAARSYGFRLSDDVGGAMFAASRVAFNRSMEEFSKLNVQTDEFVRSRLIAGEGEKRAFQAALGSIEEGVAIIDSSGKLVAFNAAMETMAGTNAELALGKMFADIISLAREGRPAEQLAGLVSRVLTTGMAEVFGGDVVLKKNDGAFLPVSVKTIPVKNELRGAVTHVAVIITPRTAASVTSQGTYREPIEAPSSPAVGSSYRASPFKMTTPPAPAPAVRAPRESETAPHSEREPLPMRVSPQGASAAPKPPAPPIPPPPVPVKPPAASKPPSVSRVLQENEAGLLRKIEKGEVADNGIPPVPKVILPDASPREAPPPNLPT